MSFRTPLRVERIENVSRDGRGTWRVLSSLVYRSEVADTIFVVPADFITDFASVPRLPVAYFLTGGFGHAAAVVHDWLYTTHEVDRRTADAVFREACQACDVPAWRAWMMWMAVRAGGGDSWDAPGPDQPVLVQQQIRSAADLVAP